MISHCRERPRASKTPTVLPAPLRHICPRRSTDPRRHRESLPDSSLFWHMASKQPRSHDPPQGSAPNSVRDPSFASGWYETLSRTALSYTHLLHNFFQKPRSRYSERADTGLSASALAPSTMSDDQCTLSMVAAAAKDLSNTVDRLRALETHGVPPAGLREAHTGPIQGTHLAQPRGDVGRPASQATTRPTQGTHLAQLRGDTRPPAAFRGANTNWVSTTV